MKKNNSLTKEMLVYYKLQQTFKINIIFMLCLVLFNTQDGSKQYCDKPFFGLFPIYLLVFLK